MARLHWLTLGAAAVLSVATALPALADGPVRPGLQIPEPQIPGQVLPRQPDPGPCPGAAEIVNQYGTCTPCLPNSIAGRTNTVCVCSRDFVEISRDAWGRATCVAAADVPTPGPDRTVVSVNVPAGEFYGYARQLGFDFRVVRAAGGPLTLCGVNQEGDAIYAEYSPVNITLAPPQIIDDESEISCDISLMGVQLNHGWELVRLQAVDDSECTGTNRGYRLTRRSSDPADTTYDLRLTSYADFCIIRIREALLRGPGAGNWRDAFSQ
ncbi:MAG: hypothetical protein KDA64_11315 [Rhodospirillaceae bacterium]|nr:hypothetical protein [Rhodospirillaceae bacterium]